MKLRCHIFDIKLSWLISHFPLSSFLNIFTIVICGSRTSFAELNRPVAMPHLASKPPSGCLLAAYFYSLECILLRRISSLSQHLPLFSFVICSVPCCMWIEENSFWSCLFICIKVRVLIINIYTFVQSKFFITSEFVRIIFKKRFWSIL